jgi:hypothetical protein
MLSPRYWVVQLLTRYHIEGNDSPLLVRVTAYQYCMDYSHHDSRRLLMCYYISISYSHNVFLPLCSWVRMSGLNILVYASLKL